MKLVIPFIFCFTLSAQLYSQKGTYKRCTPPVAFLTENENGVFEFPIFVGFKNKFILKRNGKLIYLIKNKKFKGRWKKDNEEITLELEIDSKKITRKFKIISDKNKFYLMSLEDNIFFEKIKSTIQ